MDSFGFLTFHFDRNTIKEENDRRTKGRITRDLESLKQ